MSNKESSRLRFNFGFILEGDLGTKRKMELDYPRVTIDDVILEPLKGSFQVVRGSDGLYISGELLSIIGTECARCLESMYLPISIKLDDLFYYPPNTAPLGDFGVGEDGVVDLNPLVRQLGLLEIPMKPYCRPDCKGLCDRCGQNLNNEACECETDDLDPRLESLRSLLDSKAKVED